MNRILFIAPAVLIAAGCAKGAQGLPDSKGPDVDADLTDASCGMLCDHDHDGVVDCIDQCPNTPPGQVVNSVGCADSQLTATLETNFPPYSLTWTNAGNLGRAGGLTWTYAGIVRRDLFHIYWLVCDDPVLLCGLSLDGPIDVAAEYWTFSAVDSDLPNGKLVYTNTTHILLADTSTPQLSGRLTLTIVDASDVAIHFADTATLNVIARNGNHGAEITGPYFKVVALAEVKDATSAWTPFQDYYDAAPTPPAGGGSTVSLDGAFYDK
jgi:hypothetical protein